MPEEVAHAVAPSTFENLAGLARRPATAAALLASFVVGALLLLTSLRPWQDLKFSTWPCGFEAGRIARNISAGLGYASPFLALPGDNFLSARPFGSTGEAGIESPRVQEPRPGDSPTAWITPPNVYMWVLTFALFGLYTPAAMAAWMVSQILLMTVTLGIVWRLMSRLRGPGTGALAVTLLILYPPTWYFCLEGTHGTILFLSLLVFSLDALARVFQGAGSRWVVAHCLGVALAVLTEPASVLFFFWLELWVAWVLARRSRPGATPVTGPRARVFLLAAAASCAVVWGPWVARNFAVFGTPVLFKSNLPMELFYGNNPDSPRNIREAHERRFPAWSDEERLKLLEMGEIDYARLCLRQAVEFIRGNPPAFVLLTLQRATYVWSYNPFRFSTWRPLITLLFHLALASWLFGLLALGRARRDWFDRVVLGFVVLFPIAYYLTHLMIYRYRYPLEVMLIIGAAAVLGRLRSPRDTQPGQV